MADEYISLEAGGKIQNGDEYSSNQGIWRTVPDFLVGDTIPESSTKWRRPIQGNESKRSIAPKKKWFPF